MTFKTDLRIGRPRSANLAGCFANLGGSVTAMITPFRNGDLDLESIAKLCERQVRGDTSALVVCGSTGEGQSLSEFEHGSVVAVAVDVAAGRIPVIAGCSAPSTRLAAALAQSAARNGADGLLCSAPSYSKPTQAGIVEHVRAVAYAADLPIMLYDVPSRVGVSVENATIAQLFEEGHIAAVKDATGDLARPGRLRACCGDTLVQMTGEDATALGYRAMGGHGCVSVTSNVVPALCAELHAAWLRNDRDNAERIRNLLGPLHDALFTESNPIPLKSALALLGLCTGEMRLPLTRASEATKDRLSAILTNVLPAEQAEYKAVNNVVPIPTGLPHQRQAFLARRMQIAEARPDAPRVF